MSSRIGFIAPLLGIELLKARRRPAFAAAVALFAALVVGQCWWVADTVRSTPGMQPLTLPESWRRLVYLAKVAGVIFTPATVVLLTGGEFRLGTARQQVADGSSRAQFFLAKLLVVVCVAALYWAASVLIGLAFGVAATPNVVANGPLIRLPDAQLLGAYYLALVGYGALGLFLAFAVRGAGGALAALAFYTFAVDGLAGSLLATHDRWVAVARLLPTRVFDALTNPARYEPAVFETVKARFAAADVPFPELSSTAATYATAGAWIILLSTVAYGVYARRDL